MDLCFFKVTALPSQPVPNAFYYVRNGQKAEAYLTNKNSQVFPITNTQAVLDIMGDIAGVGDPGDVTVYFDNQLV